VIDIVVNEQDFVPWLGNVLHAMYIAWACEMELSLEASINISFSLLAKCRWIQGPVIDKLHLRVCWLCSKILIWGKKSSSLDLSGIPGWELLHWGGRNAMIGSLRIKKEPLRNSFPFSFILCTLGRLRSSHLYRLVLMISLYCFLLPLRCLSCILPVYLIALCAF